MRHNSFNISPLLRAELPSIGVRKFGNLRCSFIIGHSLMLLSLVLVIVIIRRKSFVGNNNTSYQKKVFISQRESPTKTVTLIKKKKSSSFQLVAGKRHSKPLISQQLTNLKPSGKNMQHKMSVRGRKRSHITFVKGNVKCN